MKTADTAAEKFSDFNVETLVKPFTPDRPTHAYKNKNLLSDLIELLNHQGFYSSRQITIKEKQDNTWVTVASRFNNAWYVSTGLFKG
ncbi:MAG: hypothetical protein J6N72_01765 [Psychrobacter sp.]|nr:hypothetical protein [Psychrobacter sp.]